MDNSQPPDKVASGEVARSEDSTQVRAPLVPGLPAYPRTWRPAVPAEPRHEAKTIQPGDTLHVVLDALDCLRAGIDRGEVTPWRDYEAGDDDPKTSSAGYLMVLSKAVEMVQLELEKA